MGIMHIAHLERRAIPRQTAGAQRRKTPLMRQFRKRIILIHELRQRRRTKEFANGRHDRTDIDQILRMQFCTILYGHALLNDLIHARKADTQLVLQKLADAAHAAISQVVDIVCVADAVRQINQVIN